MSRPTGRRANAALWLLQGLLALLFLFAGGTKQVMSLQALSQATGLPGGFMRFIGVAEIAGALGLVLPGLFGVARWLTPLAGAGLVVIMGGAVALSAVRLGVSSAILPAIVGLLLVAVIRGRAERRPRRFSGRSFDVSLKSAQPR